MNLPDGFLETYPALALHGVVHALVPRVPGIDGSTHKGEILAQLQPWHAAAVETLGFSAEQVCRAEQVHGGDVMAVTTDSPRWIPGVDGLLTNEPGLLLAIHTADCAPVFLVDPVRRAVALLHSGRKSTEAGITPRAIAAMQQAYGTNPADLLLQIGPCIRPPLFEMDMVSRILADAAAAGVPPAHLHDCGRCTGSDLGRYYSYRVEKGRTGRLLALLGMPR